MSFQECFIGNKDCSQKIRRAHILSKMATMNLVHGPNESDQRKVILIGYQDSTFNWVPKEVGWKLASTHKCFCGKHDDMIFGPIENETVFDPKNKEHKFLQSFRAFAYTYHKKKIDQNSLYDLLNTSNELLDSLSNFTDSLSSIIGTDIKEVVPNLEDLDRINSNKSQKEESLKLQFYPYEKTRSELLEILDKKAFDEMRFITYVKSKRYPFASAGTLIGEIVDDNRAKIAVIHYDKNDPVVRKPSIFLSVMPTKEEKTVIVLSCLKSDKNGMLNLKRFANLNSVIEFEKAITSLMLSSNKENTFLNPSLWKHIKDNGNEELIIREINRERGLDLNMEKPHLSEINLFDSEFSCGNLDL